MRLSDMSALTWQNHIQPRKEALIVRPQTQNSTMSQMKILLLLETGGGGSGKHVLDLAEQLAKLNHDVHIIYCPLRAEQKFTNAMRSAHGVKLTAIEMGRTPSARDIKTIQVIRHYVKNNGPFSVIHAHSSRAGGLARLALGWNRSTPLLYTPHAFKTLDPDLNVITRRLCAISEAILGRFLTTRIICVSDDEMKHAQSISLPRSKLVCIPNGVNPTPWHHRRIARSKLGLEDDDIIVSFVGRLVQQKAPERYVRLIAALPELPSVHFLLFGDGELRRQVELEASALGVKHRIRLITDWTGQDALAGTDLFVLTSRYEGMPYVLLEALSAGTAIVASNVGGVSSTVHEGKNGYIVPNSDDIGPFICSMSKILSNRKILNKFKAYSLELSKQFTMDRMVQKTVTLYKSSNQRNTSELWESAPESSSPPSEAA